MPVPASSTTVGASRKVSQNRGTTSKQSGGFIHSDFTRKTATNSKSRVTSGAGNSGMWKFYSEDSPGVRVGPVPILVVSLTFVASVFMLHIWGKYTRY